MNLLGLGDSPHGWSGFAQEFVHTVGEHVKFILPYAPEQDVTCNGGAVMPSWMDLMEIPIRINSPDNGRQQDESISIIHSIIHEVIASGIPSERIVIGGFSQGGALALASTIKSHHKLAGCCCLSGWALPKQNLANMIQQSPSSKSPFLICHGENDQTVLPENAHHISNILIEAGVSDMTLKTYPRVTHSMSPQVLLSFFVCVFFFRKKKTCFLINLMFWFSFFFPTHI